MLKRNLLKRTLSVIVSMAMIFQPIPTTAYAAENETQAVEQAAEESSSTSENETAPQSSAQESEAAPESSTQESIDVNKDGEADIVVSKYSTSSNYVYVTVRITDRDAVLATAAGKTYSIPVTVTVIGRDGIAKDSSAVIKVKVKR